MAAVFLAFDPYTKRKVAIKVLPYLSTNNESLLEYFYKEAETIAALEHANIVPLFDFGEHGVQPYIVMRYMAGGSLADILVDGPVPPREFAPLFTQIAGGLDMAHARGIIHRDIKPANIMFDEEGIAYLSDFGLAKSYESQQASQQTWFVGTPEYMSPEQVRNQILDGRSDIYALGVVLFELLVGYPPFREEGSIMTAIAHVNSAVPKVNDLDPTLPKAWDEILGKALAKDREDRYETAGEFAEDVSELAAGRWFLRRLLD
jgi:serine/threonine-protein kinase